MLNIDKHMICNSVLIINKHKICNSMVCELNYHDQKIWQTLAQNIWKHWTAVSTLLDLLSSVYRDLPHWRSNQ